MARTESETQDGGKEGEERNLSSLCVPGTFLNASHAGGRYFFKVLQGWRVTFREVELFRGPSMSLRTEDLLGPRPVES